MNDKQRAELPVQPEVRARTLLALLWRKYDAAGISMGRSYDAVILEAAMELLGDANIEDVRRLDAMNGADVLQDTRNYLSALRAEREGFILGNHEFPKMNSAYRG